LGGTAFYKIGNDEQKFKQGYLYILPANKVFSLREDTEDKFYSVYIHAYTFPEIDKVIEVSVEDDRFLKDTLEMMRKYMRKSDRNYVRRMTDMLLSYVCEKGEGGEDLLASKIKTYIETHFVEVFKRSTLINEFNYSDSHLSRVFKEAYDITPKRYAQQLVLQESVSLLRNGISVAQISQRLDFSSPENFSRFFKSYYGCSPRDYMKKFKHFPV
jgi:AraC-like DNA-binding protein